MNTFNPGRKMIDESSIFHLLEERFGINKAKMPKEQWERSIRERREELGVSEVAYEDLVKRSTVEATRLAEKLVIPETWFFREEREIHAFVEWLTSEEERFRRGTPAKILSLGCSTGEEPYSIALAIKNALDGQGLFRMEAVDLSGEALKFAERGIYSSSSFRGEGVKKYQKFFKELPDERWSVPDDLRFAVSFKKRNLLDFPMKHQKGQFDAIFCRNVLIYFSERRQSEIVDRLIEALKPGGVLILGEMEAAKLYNKLTRRRFPSCSLFVKEVREKEPIHEGSRSLHELFKLKEEGSVEEGIRLAKELIVREPSCAKAYCLLGSLYHSNGKLHEAKSAFENAVNYNPNDVEALTYLYMMTAGSENEEIRNRLEKLLGGSNGSI